MSAQESEGQDTNHHFCVGNRKFYPSSHHTLFCWTKIILAKASTLWESLLQNPLKCFSHIDLKDCEFAWKLEAVATPHTSSSNNLKGRVWIVGVCLPSPYEPQPQIPSHKPESALIWLVSQSGLLLTLEFWTQGLESWGSICQVQPLVPICQIKRHDEGPRKIYGTAQDTPWEEVE
jgi:hypothetical protein